MKFSCEHCGKRFATEDEPVPGRVYRIPCRCGNTIILGAGAPRAPAPAPHLDATPRVTPTRIADQRRAAAAAAAPARAPAAPVAPPAAELPDDPFAHARPRRGDLPFLLAHAEIEVTPTFLGVPLARRDPDAPEEVSGSHAVEPDADPIGEELRRTRIRALALGAAAGVPVGALLTILAALVFRSPPPAPSPGPPTVGDAPPVVVAAPAAEPAPAAPAATPAPPPSAAAPPRRRAPPPSTAPADPARAPGAAAGADEADAAVREPAALPAPEPLEPASAPERDAADGATRDRDAPADPADAPADASDVKAEPPADALPAPDPTPMERPPLQEPADPPERAP